MKAVNSEPEWLLLMKLTAAVVSATQQITDRSNVVEVNVELSAEACWLLEKPVFPTSAASW